MRVIVIGAGAFGCAISRELAISGCQVTLIDRHDPGSQASINNAGNLNPLLMTPPALLPLALESFRLHQKLPQALRVHPHTISAVRRLLLAFTAAEAQPFTAIQQSFEKTPGFSATFVNPTDLSLLEPGLNHNLYAALLLEGNLAIDGEDLLRALRDDASAYGVQMIHNHVQQVRTKGQNVTHVHTGEDIPCDALVLATGAQTDCVEQWLGIPIPLTPLKGQMLRMKVEGYPLSFDITHGDFSLYKRRENEIWVGMTQEQAGHCVNTTASACAKLREGVQRFLPAMASARLITQTAALRPATASGLPIASKVPTFENAYIANGGGNKGMLLCTGISHIMRDLVLTNEHHFQSSLHPL